MANNPNKKFMYQNNNLFNQYLAYTGPNKLPLFFDSEEYKNLDKTIELSELDKQTEKFVEYIDFLVDEAETYSNMPKQLFANKIREILIYANKIGLKLQVTKLQKDSWLKFLGDYPMLLTDTKPKRTWVWKKVGIPTIVVASLCGIAGLVLGALPLVAGALPFLTSSTLLNALALGSLGFIAGCVSTPIIIKTRHKVITERYKKLGRKSNTIQQLIESDEVGLEHLTINKLIKDFENDEAKRAKLENSNNPFKKLRRYHLKKVNRDRLHELVAFRIDLNQIMENNEAFLETTTIEKLTVLSNAISEFITDKKLFTDYASIATKAYMVTAFNEKKSDRSNMRVKVKDFKQAHLEFMNEFYDSVLEIETVNGSANSNDDLMDNAEVEHTEEKGNGPVNEEEQAIEATTAVTVVDPEPEQDITKPTKLISKITRKNMLKENFNTYAKDDEFYLFSLTRTVSGRISPKAINHWAEMMEIEPEALTQIIKKIKQYSADGSTLAINLSRCTSVDADAYFKAMNYIKELKKNLDASSTSTSDKVSILDDELYE